MTDKSIDSKEYSLTLLRHGESLGNAQGFYQGQSDFPLSPTGEKQAQSLAARWVKEEVTFDLIISSPLIRARHTAEIISSTLSVPIEFDPLWMERNAGLLEGLHEKEAREKHPPPEFFSLYYPYGETGESQWDLYLRAGRALKELLNRPVGRYLIVSHGALLNMVLYTALGILPQANFQGAHFALKNAGFSRLVYYPDHHYWIVECINEDRHLQGCP